MSEGSRKLVDTPGDFCYAVKNGQPVEDPQWRSCKVILSEELLVLSTASGQQSVPLGSIRHVDQQEVNEVVPGGISVGSASVFRINDSLVLIDTKDGDHFASDFHRANLYDEVLIAKPRAVVDGSHRDDAKWSKVKFRMAAGKFKLAMPDDEIYSIPLDSVEKYDIATEAVMSEPRQVIQITYVNDGEEVETYLSGTETHTAALETILEIETADDEPDYELTDTDKQVLMGLYSGVSPFEIAGLVGLSVDELEEVYDKLLDVGAVDKVRERTEVELNDHGRNLASEAMNEE